MSSDFRDSAGICGNKPVSDPDEIAADRFAPADNLYDAIRADLKAIGGIDFEPLPRE
jgi:hypothetical protein